MSPVYHQIVLTSLLFPAILRSFSWVITVYSVPKFNQLIYLLADISSFSRLKEISCKDVFHCHLKLVQNCVLMLSNVSDIFSSLSSCFYCNRHCTSYICLPFQLSLVTMTQNAILMDIYLNSASFPTKRRNLKTESCTCTGSMRKSIYIKITTSVDSAI